MIHPSKKNEKKYKKNKKRRKKHKRRRRRYSSSSSSDTDGIADHDASSHDTKRVTYKRPELFAHNIERPYSFPLYGFTTSAMNAHSVAPYNIGGIYQ